MTGIEKQRKFGNFNLVGDHNYILKKLKNSIDEIRYQENNQ